MYKPLLILYLLLTFNFVTLLSADTLESEIGGLVLDRSFSRFGKQFYHEFCTLWREVEDTSGHNIAVIESVIPRSGTVLWVEVNNTKVFQTFFGRRNSTTVKRGAGSAINLAAQHLAKKSYQSQSRDMVGDGY